MGPPAPVGSSRGKRRATNDSSSSVSDYISADEDSDEGGGGARKKARAAPGPDAAGNPQFDAYVHEGHYFNSLGYQTFLTN